MKLVHPVGRALLRRSGPNSVHQKMEAARSSETSKHYNPTGRNNPEELLGTAMAQAVNRLPLSQEAWVRPQACLCGICGG